MNKTPSNIIELHFPVTGEKLCTDHGYALYSAISKLIPEVHSAAWLGIHTLKGRKIADGIISLGRGAKLKLRLPAEKAALLSSIAGRTLEINGHNLRCGIPEFHVLRPAKRLRSRFVIIKSKETEGKNIESASFYTSLQKQVAALGVKTDVMLEHNIVSHGQDGTIARRVLRVKSANLTGYGVILDNLSDSDSLVIQEVGLGGKRRMGCGLFAPLRRDV